MVNSAKGVRRVAYWVMAGLFFCLAMIGVILPGIPTTPFLLLMCYFLMRVSPTLHAKAMRWPIIGVPLRDWHVRGGVRFRVKLFACMMVTLLVGSTLIWSSFSPTIKSIILLSALYGISVVVRLPIAKKLVVSDELPFPLKN